VEVSSWPKKFVSRQFTSIQQSPKLHPKSTARTNGTRWGATLAKAALLFLDSIGKRLLIDRQPPEPISSATPSVLEVQSSRRQSFDNRSHQCPGRRRRNAHANVAAEFSIVSAATSVPDRSLRVAKWQQVVRGLFSSAVGALSDSARSVSSQFPRQTSMSVDNSNECPASYGSGVDPNMQPVRFGESDSPGRDPTLPALKRKSPAGAGQVFPIRGGPAQRPWTNRWTGPAKERSSRVFGCVVCPT
jgi:hypothetical protein